MSYRLFFLCLLTTCIFALNGLLEGTAATWTCKRPALSTSNSLRCSGEGRALKGAYGWLLSERIDLNQAQWSDFVLVRGVGAHLAYRLIHQRQQQGRFSSWDELAAVPGVGPKKLELLKKYFFF